MSQKREEAKDSSVHQVVTEVSKIVSAMAGIQLGAKQHSMVENRLRSRMIKLGIQTFAEYLEHLKRDEESESQALLSLMTTHHTYFFREFSHFEYLLSNVLPEAIEEARKRSDKRIRVWSAACSRGQEVYSLAMFLDYHLKAMAPDLSFEVLGTDVDPESVQHSRNGVYRSDELKKSPSMYLEGQWTRGTGSVAGFSRVRPELKARCQFEVFNLLAPSSSLNGRKFDIIFCRNVFIYFSPEQIRAATAMMLRQMDPHGVLVLGVSETLNGLGLNVDLVGPSIYRFKTASNERAKATGTVQSAPSAATLTRPIEILCVDDSSTIHALMKKILTPEQGFQLKAKAMNGREALEILKSQTFDAITLDLHMPEIDGLGFLKEYGPDKIPVMIVSSINRDDPSVAQKALKLGVKDYVEKPSLENLSEAGNEIRSKIKTMLRGASQTFNSASKATVTPSKELRVMVVDDSATIRKLLKQGLEAEAGIKVVSEIGEPLKVEEAVQKIKPDLITMDIHMPDIDGVSLVRRLVPRFRTPIVMISSLSREDGPQVLAALEAGAVDYIQKPEVTNLGTAMSEIRSRLRLAAEAKVSGGPRRAKKVFGADRLDLESGLILLGASTGGTEALRVVLESLPQQIPPVLIVQHIPPVFSAAFAERLNQLCPFEVREAKDGDEVIPNRVLIAPGGRQMGVRRTGDKLLVRVTDDAPVNRHRPSVDYLFASVSRVEVRGVIAGVLTGMGADGADGLKRLRDGGARTFAQDEQTSVVYGMPKEATINGGAEVSLPLESVGEYLMKTVTKQTKRVA